MSFYINPFIEINSCALLAQWLERLSPEEKVASSNLAMRGKAIVFLQLSKNKRPNESYLLHIVHLKEDLICENFVFLNTLNLLPFFSIT